MNRDKLKGALFAVGLVLLGYVLGAGEPNQKKVFAQIGREADRWIGVGIPQGGSAAFFKTDGLSRTTVGVSYGYVVNTDGSMRDISTRW